MQSNKNSRSRAPRYSGPPNKLSDMLGDIPFSPIRIVDDSSGLWKCSEPDLKKYTLGDQLPEKTSLRIGENPGLLKLGYDSFSMKITPEETQILGTNERSSVYAIRLLGEFATMGGGEVPTGIIEDGSVIEDRGYMLDVSRGRIPRKHQFIRLLDYLSLLRYNHLELYFEHTFAYKNHETVWKDWSPLSSEDIIFLDRECRIRGIELVPNQNSFGHMRTWLEHKEYKHLAECPEGFEDPWGSWRDYPFSFSPVEPEVFTLLEELYDELLPHFSSTRFNVGLDETFDLSQGKSKQLCDVSGKGRVYLDYLKQVHQMVNNRNHKMLFWGDIIQNHEELVDELPPEVTAVEWGYEDDHDFDGRSRKLKENRIEFINAPGTSLWNTAAGRYNIACKNIDIAVDALEKYEGTGLLLTDWGDNGHIPPPDLSWPLIAYSAFRSWQGIELEIKNPVRWYLKSILLAEPEQIGQLENIYLHISNLDEMAGSKIMNGSVLCTALFTFDTPNGKGILDNLPQEKIGIFETLIEQTKKELNELEGNMSPSLEKFVEDIRFALLLASYGLEALKWHMNCGIPEKIQNKYSELEAKLRTLWHRDYRDGGYDFSISHLNKIVLHSNKQEK